MTGRTARFLIVGGGAAALLWLLTFLFLQLGLPAFPSGLAAYACAFVVAYLLQRNWTFGGAGRHSRTLPRYLLVQAFCALASGGLSHLLTSILGWPAITASLTMTVCVSAFSYLASTYWVFADET